MKTFKEFLNDDVIPANAAGTGQIAGIGVGSNGEPGVKRKKKSPILATLKRKCVDAPQKRQV